MDKLTKSLDKYTHERLLFDQIWENQLKFIKKKCIDTYICTGESEQEAFWRVYPTALVTKFQLAQLARRVRAVKRAYKNGCPKRIPKMADFAALAFNRKEPTKKKLKKKVKVLKKKMALKKKKAGKKNKSKSKKKSKTTAASCPLMEGMGNPRVPQKVGGHSVPDCSAKVKTLNVLKKHLLSQQDGMEAIFAVFGIEELFGAHIALIQLKRYLNQPGELIKVAKRIEKMNTILKA